MPTTTTKDHKHNEHQVPEWEPELSTEPPGPPAWLGCLFFFFLVLIAYFLYWLFS